MLAGGWKSCDVLTSCPCCLFPARSPRICHWSELTERDWENTVQGLGNHSWRCSIFELVASHYIFWGKCQSDTCIVSHFAHNISLSTLQIKTQWSSHSLTWWREHDSWLYHNKAVIILTLLNFRLIPILFFTTCDCDGQPCSQVPRSCVGLKWSVMKRTLRRVHWSSLKWDMLWSARKIDENYFLAFRLVIN